MINPKEAIFDRIEQTFDLFKRNAKELFLPMFAFQFITTVVLYTIISTIFFSMLNFGDLSSGSDAMKSFGDLYTNPKFILFITVVIFLVLSYLTIIAPFLIATIRGISLSYKGEKVDMLEIIKYGFTNFSNAFKTYWYIFAYIALIPSLIIIIGGFLVIYGQFNANNIMNIGFYIVGIGALILMFTSIIRGVKSTFSLYSAVDKNSYTKTNFKFSILVTKENWWRIWGNLFLLGLIISLISGVFSSIIGMISSIGSGFSITDLVGIKNKEQAIAVITTMMDNMGKTTFFSIIGDTLNLFIGVIASIFTYIFTYIFFKRLEVESCTGTDAKSVSEL